MIDAIGVVGRGIARRSVEQWPVQVRGVGELQQTVAQCADLLGGGEASLWIRRTVGGLQGEITHALPATILSDLYLGHTLAGLLAWYGNPSIPLRGVLAGVTHVFWNGTSAKPAS